jgi:hypothetical protein
MPSISEYAKAAWDKSWEIAGEIGKAIAEANQPKIHQYSDGTCYEHEIDEGGYHSWKVPCPSTEAPAPAKDTYVAPKTDGK